MVVIVVIVVVVVAVVVVIAQSGSSTGEGRTCVTGIFSCAYRNSGIAQYLTYGTMCQPWLRERRTSVDPARLRGSTDLDGGSMASRPISMNVLTILLGTFVGTVVTAVQEIDSSYEPPQNPGAYQLYKTNMPEVRPAKSKVLEAQRATTSCNIIPLLQQKYRT